MGGSRMGAVFACGGMSRRGGDAGGQKEYLGQMVYGKN